MTKVAIRASRGTPDVYHKLDDGEVDCRLGRRDDREFRHVDADNLFDHVEQCTLCYGEPDVHRGGGEGWATKLRAADDPEEVLADD